jgi:hypothetical protein
VFIAPDLASLWAPLQPLERLLGASLQAPSPAGSEGSTPSGKPEGVLTAGNGGASLPDGTALVRLRDLVKRDTAISLAWNATDQTAEVRRGAAVAIVRAGRITLAGAITFANEPGAYYLPRAEVEQVLGPPPVDVESKPRKGVRPARRTLFDGTALVRLRDLSRAGAALEWNEKDRATRVSLGERTLWVREERKRVVINLAAQRLRGWEGARQVFDTRISSGRRGMGTPRGAFTAGPIKSLMVISRKYGNAPMPWSVQVQGNIFIHGAASVPRRPASHGCVRVPLFGGNPARWFYGWVNLGTPIVIRDGWPGDRHHNADRPGGKRMRRQRARAKRSAKPPVL